MICFGKRYAVAIVVGLFDEEHNETYRNVPLEFEVRNLTG